MEACKVSLVKMLSAMYFYIITSPFANILTNFELVFLRA